MRRLVLATVAILLSELLSASPLQKSSRALSGDGPSDSSPAKVLAFITITTNPSGLQISLDGQQYTAPQTIRWTTGSQHTISTTSPQGSSGTRRVFSSWSDGGVQTHSINVGASDTTYTANFSTQYLLTTASSPVGGGSISKIPSSSDDYYNSGTSVQLTAAPSGGYAFTSWSSDLTGSANPQPIVMSAPRSVTANFASVSNITIATNPSGLQISIDGKSYTAPQLFQWQAGSQHTISAPSPQGSSGTRRVFSSWDDGGVQTHSISAGASDTTYTANFSTQYLLTTTSSPVGAGSISKIPSSSDGYYTSGTSVQLTATPSTGYTFTSWSSDLTGSANPQSIVMSAPRSVTANFVSFSNITITTEPPGLQVSIDGTSDSAPQFFRWQVGSQHTISAPSPQGSLGTRRVFSSWSDGGVQTHSINVDASDMTYTANFITQFLLTTASSPVGAGSASKTPSSSDGYYASGTSVQLTATSSSGYTFTSWSSDLTGSANPQSIVMSAPRSATANFSKLSGIGELDPAIPETFALSANYPNPFNPSTIVDFQLPIEATVRLSVFDLLGRELAVLVNEEKPAGRYSVAWDATNCSSGIYFYRLQARNPSTGSAPGFVETKRMILLK